MPKVNSKRLLIALIVGIVVLNIIGPVQGMLEYWFNAYSGLPESVVVEKNIGTWMAGMILLSITFEVVLPMLIYVFLVEKYFLKSSLVIGMSFGLVAFLVGAFPQYIMIPLLIKVSITFSFVRSACSLFNLVLIGGIIGGIYKPLELMKKEEAEENVSPI